MVTRAYCFFGLREMFCHCETAVVIRVVRVVIKPSIFDKTSCVTSSCLDTRWGIYGLQFQGNTLALGAIL